MKAEGSELDTLLSFSAFDSSVYEKSETVEKFSAAGRKIQECAEKLSVGSKRQTCGAN
jgi:hypothetical protein